MRKLSTKILKEPQPERKTGVIMTEKTVISEAKRQNPVIPAIRLTANHLLLSLVRFGQVPNPGGSILDMEESEARKYLKKYNVYLKK